MASEERSTKTMQWSLPDLEACQAMALWLAEQVMDRDRKLLPLTLGLVGPLGAGKTQWTKFFAQALGALPEEISSPTYVLIHRYGSRPPIYHIDAYRVNDEDEFLELGIEELFEAPSITIVEWADRFRDSMPDTTVWITFALDPLDPSKRTVTIECGSKGPLLEGPRT